MAASHAASRRRSFAISAAWPHIRSRPQTTAVCSFASVRTRHRTRGRCGCCLAGRTARASATREANVTGGDSCKRFDHELFLSCPHASLEIVDGVTHENRNFALKPARYAPTRERIEQTLERRSLVRGENSKVHG